MAGTSTGRRLAVPLFVSIAILTASPFLGLLRDWLNDISPRAFAPTLTAGFAVALGVAAVFAWRHIRNRRLVRLGGCLLAGMLVALQVTGFARDRADVSAVERIHILEYGLLALLFYWALKPSAGAVALLLAGLAAATVGVLDETVQWLVPTRVGEVRDVLLNWAAVATGLVAAVSLAPPASRAGPRPRRARQAAGLLLAGLILVFAFYFDLAHLGHRIEDPGAGLAFRSWVDGDRLRERAADRARLWSRRPPERLAPLSREDTFLTEGTAHVQHRNRSLSRGHLRSAWGEQRILERWYAPVLELRGLATGQLLGLEPWKRERLRRRAGGQARTGSYESPVLSGRIHRRPPRTALWAAALLLATGSLVGALPARPRPRFLRKSS